MKPSLGMGRGEPVGTVHTWSNNKNYKKVQMNPPLWVEVTTGSLHHEAGGEEVVVERPSLGGISGWFFRPEKTASLARARSHPAADPSRTHHIRQTPDLQGKRLGSRAPLTVTRLWRAMALRGQFDGSGRPPRIVQSRRSVQDLLLASPPPPLPSAALVASRRLRQRSSPCTHSSPSPSILTCKNMNP